MAASVSLNQIFVPDATLRYRLAPSGNAREMRVVWRVETPGPTSNFAGFVLRAAQAWVPARSDGVELFRWSPRPGGVTGDHEARVSLESNRSRSWPRFYCRAFTLEAAQEPTTLIIHPNTCLDSGEFLASQRVKRRPRWPRRAPRKIICPWCLHEFPAKEMLFTDHGGTRPVRGRFTWWDWLRGRPPRPPLDQKGRILTRKYCPRPECYRDLPFSVDLTPSLFIALIGAVSSGKSHYVTSLIHRLRGTVGTDLSACLIPATQDTAQRYERDFYRRLFVDRHALPMTIGTPFPLSYELTIDGKLWGEDRHRSTTLVLYEPSGANLGIASGVVFLIDPLQVETVRQLVPPSALPTVDPLGDPCRMIGHVFLELENGKAMAGNAPPSIPIAVALTKCDVLREHGLIEPNRLWSSDQRHIRAYDTAMHDDMNGMMGEYMCRWNEELFAIVRSRFPMHAFFGASATGCAQDPKTGVYPYIAPFRVEDPLLLLLSELGVIPTR